MPYFIIFLLVGMRMLAAEASDKSCYFGRENLSQLLLTIVRSLENPADGSDRTSKLIRIQLTHLSPRRETGGGLPMTGRLSW